MSMIACPHCGFPNTAERSICKSCRQDLRAQTEALSDTPLPPAELGRVLDAEIVRQQATGWRLQSRTETTAQMVREVSDTNGCVLLLLLCLAIIPGILYAAFAKRTSSLYLSVDPYGRIGRMIDGQGVVPAVPAVTSETARLSGPPAPDVETRLAQLARLRDAGTITEPEYAARRQRILDEL